MTALATDTRRDTGAGTIGATGKVTQVIGSTFDARFPDLEHGGHYPLLLYDLRLSGHGPEVLLVEPRGGLDVLERIGEGGGGRDEVCILRPGLRFVLPRLRQISA